MTDIEQAINFLVNEGQFDFADAVVALVADNQRLKDHTWGMAGEIDQLSAEHHRLLKTIQILQGRLYLNRINHSIDEEV